MRLCGSGTASTSGVAVAVAVAVPIQSWRVCGCYTFFTHHTYPESVSANRKRNRIGIGKVFCENRANVKSYYEAEGTGGKAFDAELRSVLELATESELCEIERILFGPSYLSPLLKSIATTTKTTTLDRSMIGYDIQQRQQFIAALESRFFFLAADARSTIRGWRPSSYRNVLLHLRNKLNIPCSSQLSTHDLELEIFLNLLHCSNSTDESGNYTGLSQGTLQLGLNQWKIQSKVGAKHFPSILLKGGGILTVAKIYQLLARKLSGKMLVEAANYQVKKELVKKGGQLAMINLESRAALLAAKQGFLGAASRYLGFRSMITLLGPVLWGTFLADLVIQMLGTDYARILRTIFALAQVLNMPRIIGIATSPICLMWTVTWLFCHHSHHVYVIESIRVIRTYKLPSDVTAV